MGPARPPPGLHALRPTSRSARSRDPDLGRAQELARQFGVPRAVADHRDVLALGVDALAIVAPDDVHHAVASAALDAGLPVLCEKPLARTVDEASRPRPARGGRRGGDEARLRLPVQSRAAPAPGARPGRIRGASPHPDRLQPEPPVPGPSCAAPLEDGAGADGRRGVRGVRLAQPRSRPVDRGRAHRGVREHADGRGPAPGSWRRLAPRGRRGRRVLLAREPRRRRRGGLPRELGVPRPSRGATSPSSATPAPSCGDAATTPGRSPSSSAPRPRRPASEPLALPAAAHRGSRVGDDVAGVLHGESRAAGSWPRSAGRPPEGPTFLDGYRAQLALDALATSLAERRWVTVPA